MTSLLKKILLCFFFLVTLFLNIELSLSQRNISKSQSLEFPSYSNKIQQLQIGRGLLSESVSHSVYSSHSIHAVKCPWASHNPIELPNELPTETDNSEESVENEDTSLSLGLLRAVHTSSLYFIAQKFYSFEILSFSQYFSGSIERPPRSLSFI